MLCLSGELSYVHEPFNPGIWPRWTTKPMPFRNLYLCEDNGGPWVADIARVLERRFPARAQLGDIRSLPDAGRLLRDTVVRRPWRPPGRRRPTGTLMKDPIAIFSAEWLASHFDMEIVVMIRGAVEFAGSIKRLGWAFDFTNWTDQPLLMRDHLGDHADAIHRAVAEPPDLIDQAILTWNVTYTYVERMKQSHPEWHFVDHRRLAAAPLDEFEALYGALGLRFDRRVAQAIDAHSAETNVKSVPQGDKGDIRRDSRAAIETWRQRLTPEEIERVEQGTRAVASQLHQAREGL